MKYAEVSLPISYVSLARFPSLLLPVETWFSSIAGNFYDKNVNLTESSRSNKQPVDERTPHHPRHRHQILVLHTHRTNSTNQRTVTTSQTKFKSTMFSPQLAVLASFVASLASANPISPVPLSKRSVGGIRLCDEPNWGGNCWYGVVPLNACIALNSL
jgi:hypothetical protein